MECQPPKRTFPPKFYSLKSRFACSAALQGAMQVFAREVPTNRHEGGVYLARLGDYQRERSRGGLASGQLATPLGVVCCSPLVRRHSLAIAVSALMYDPQPKAIHTIAKTCF